MFLTVQPRNPMTCDELARALTDYIHEQMYGMQHGTAPVFPHENNEPDSRQLGAGNNYWLHSGKSYGLPEGTWMLHTRLIHMSGAFVRAINDNIGPCEEHV